MATNNRKDIRKRITSVKNTQKITGAMKLVSASYFAKASVAVLHNRPYAFSFDEIVKRVLAEYNCANTIETPFLRINEEKKVLLVIVSSDRGLCGGLNTNNFKNVQQWIREKELKDTTVDLVCWGRKAHHFAKKLKNKIQIVSERALEKPSYEKAKELSLTILSPYLTKQYDVVYIAYPFFKSAMEQVPSIQQILPIVQEDSFKNTIVGSTKIEPALPIMLDKLLERKIYGDIFKILLNGAASEHGARMTAMDAATNNADEVIKQLTIKYNRARQAAITKELIEIISGADSLQ